MVKDRKRGRVEDGTMWKGLTLRMGIGWEGVTVGERLEVGKGCEGRDTGWVF